MSRTRSARRWLEIVAGLRFDSFKLDVDDLRPAGGRDFSRRDNLWSPRLGLVLKPSDNLSLYASYSRSYLPQSGDQFSGLDRQSPTALKPERFDNYELGAKWEPLDGLLATAAIYQLDRTNTRATDPLHPAPTVLTGAQRSRGLELGLERSISDRWQISAGYACRRRRSPRRPRPAPSGDCEVPLVPAPQLLAVEPLRRDRQRSALGLGVIARSKSYASISNAGEAARLRAGRCGALYYKLPRGLEAQVNVENILGADYFPTANSDNNIAPGAPRTVKATARLRLLGGELRRAVADPLEVVDEQRALLAPAVLVGDAQQEARVDRHPAFAAVGERRAARRGPCRSSPTLPNSDRRRGRAERDGHRRPDQRALLLDPPAAGLDLAGVGLVVDAPLAALHEFEMLDRIGDVDRRRGRSRPSPAPRRTTARRGRRTGGRRDPPGRPAARRRT